MTNYLDIAKTARTKVQGQKSKEPTPGRYTNESVEEGVQQDTATKATKATKVPEPRPASGGNLRDQSDISDQRVSFTPLTVSEALAEIHRWGSGAGKNAELFRCGELTEEQAVEYVTCAILQHHGESFRAWKHHASSVRKALGYCIHELPPAECKVCNGYVKKLIEEGKDS